MMHEYTWYVPISELDDYDKMRWRLQDTIIPLYYLPTNGLVDGLNISNPFVENAKIGTAQIYYHKEEVAIVFNIDDSTDMGNIAIELTDEIIDNNLSKNQLYITITMYADNLCAVLQNRVQVLGTLQEDYYSAYFTGNTIRKYAYMKEDYWKRNYTEKELKETTTEENDTDGRSKKNKRGFLFKRSRNK